MSQRDVGAPELFGQVGPSAGAVQPSVDASAGAEREEETVDELVGYRSVPPRCGGAVLVRVRRGQRVQPLPYPVVEEGS